MIKSSIKESVLKPLLIGLVFLAFGGGLLLYYYKFAKESSVASFVISYAVVVAGIFVLLSAIYFLYKYKMQVLTLQKGELINAEFISYDSDVSTKNQTYYKITFKYNYLDKEVTFTSSNEFLWVHVLTLKANKEIKLRKYKNYLVIDENLEELFEKNKEEIRQIEKKYHEAYESVDKLLK